MRAIIMRGIPGFGKSTFVKKVIPQLVGSDIIVCSADKEFVGEDGVYRFERDKLWLAHKKCRSNFGGVLKLPVDFQAHAVVCDNTNTTAKEIRPYYEMGEASRNYTVIYEIQPIDGDWDRAVKIGAENNVHGVPRQAIERMKDRILKSCIPEEWNRVIVKRGHGFFEIEGEKYEI